MKPEKCKHSECKRDPWIWRNSWKQQDLFHGSIASGRTIFAYHSHSWTLKFTGSGNFDENFFPWRSLLAFHLHLYLSVDRSDSKQSGRFHRPGGISGGVRVEGVLAVNEAVHDSETRQIIEDISRRSKNLRAALSRRVCFSNSSFLRWDGQFC
jgi:hypothetical protein